MSLINNIKSNEGFSSTVYKDTEGFDTIGYGTKMPLTKDEATLILEHRLNKMVSDVITNQPFIANLTENAQEVIYEMCYQMGVSGFLKFKKMIEALKSNNFGKASAEMLDSKWAIQTPNRAFTLSQKLRRGA